jgi:hypothetical protein
VEISNQLIEVDTECKLLGVFLTDTLNWNAQCDYVVSKLRSICFLFTMLRNNVSEPVLRQVYFAYVQSHILYSIVIWGASPHIEKVSAAQKRIIRSIAGFRSHWNGEETISCRPLYKKYDILPVFSLYILECAKFVKNYPEKFETLKDNTDSGVRLTRNKATNDCDLIVKECTLQMSTQNPYVMIARIFNHMPLALKLLIHDEKFLCSVKEMLNEHIFYDKHEYFSYNFNQQC